MPNSATLVQALLAAFCAILCALSSLGGGGMMIGARTAAWEKSGAPLPYDAEVEYLKSTGSQFIDAGITLTNEDAISVRFSCNVKDSAFVGVCGTRSGASSNNISIGVNYNERRCVVDFNNSDYNLFRGSVPTDVPGDIISATSSREKRCGTVNDGAEYGNYEICPDVFETSNTAKIFRVDGIRISNDIRIFSASISRNGTMLLDLVPVRFTNENGVSEGAMYDRVSGQLFRNAGTGAFVIGPDKTT